MGEGKIEGTLALPFIDWLRTNRTAPPPIADDFSTSVNRHLPYFITFHRSVM